MKHRQDHSTRLRQMIDSVRRIRLKNRMFLFSVAIPVCIAACISVSFSVTSNQLVLQKTQEYIESQTHQIKYNLDSYLTHSLNALNALSTNTAVIQAVNSHNKAQQTGDWSAFPVIQDRLYWTARELPGLVGLEISGLHESVTYNTRPVTAGDVTSSQILRATLESPDRITCFGYMEMESRPHISNVGRTAIVFGIQIKSYIDGRVIGALVVALSSEYLTSNLLLPQHAADSGFIVLDEWDRVVLSTHPAGEGLGLPLEFPAQPAERMRVFGQEHLVYQLEIEQMNWRVISLTNYHEVTMAFLRNYIIAILIALALTAFLFLCTLFVTRSVTSPIEDLLQTMKRTSGNAYPLASVSGSDELTHLCKTYNKMSGRIQDLIAQIEAAYEKKREAEYLALQSQINPHLLYNTLDSINWMAFTVGNQEICDTIQSLSNFFRLSLNKGCNFTTIRKELEQVACYIQLINLQYNNKITLDVQADPAVLDSEVPKIILQPLVENSLMHGFSDNNLSIRIAATLENGDIKLSVEDDGCGIAGLADDDTAPAPQHSGGRGGYGLHNIDERIRLHFGQQYGVTLQPASPRGLVVNIRIPRQNVHTKPNAAIAYSR